MMTGTVEQNAAIMVNAAAMNRIEDSIRRLLSPGQQRPPQDNKRSSGRKESSNEEHAFLLKRLDQLEGLLAARVAAKDLTQTGIDSSFSSLVDDGYESDDGMVPHVHVIQVKKGSHKRARKENKTPDVINEGQKESGLSAEDLAKFIGKDLPEVVKSLNQQLAASRAAKRLPEYLTEDEKEKGKENLANLVREWKLANEYELGPFDYFDIGVLDNETADLPRRAVWDIVRTRKNKDKIRRLRGAGKVVTECETCGKAIVGNQTHQCLKTTWTFGGKKKAGPTEKKLLVSQTGHGNINISQHTEYDHQKIDTEYKKMRELQILANERARIDNSSPATACPATEMRDTTPAAEKPDGKNTTVQVDSVLIENALKALLQGNFRFSGEANSTV